MIVHFAQSTTFARWNGIQKNNVGDTSNLSGSLLKCIPRWMSRMLVPKIVRVFFNK